MKVLVDSLPYYHDECPVMLNPCELNNSKSCPWNWDKYYVCSDENPRECEYLKEFEIYIKEVEGEKRK